MLFSKRIGTNAMFYFKFRIKPSGSICLSGRGGVGFLLGLVIPKMLNRVPTAALIGVEQKELEWGQSFKKRFFLSLPYLLKSVAN